MWEPSITCGDIGNKSTLTHKREFKNRRNDQKRNNFWILFHNNSKRVSFLNNYHIKKNPFIHKVKVTLKCPITYGVKIRKLGKKHQFNLLVFAYKLQELKASGFTQKKDWNHNDIFCSHKLICVTTIGKQDNKFIWIELKEHSERSHVKTQTQAMSNGWALASQNFPHEL